MSPLAGQLHQRRLPAVVVLPALAAAVAHTGMWQCGKGDAQALAWASHRSRKAPYQGFLIILCSGLPPSSSFSSFSSPSSASFPSPLGISPTGNSWTSS